MNDETEAHPGTLHPRMRPRDWPAIRTQSLWAVGGALLALAILDYFALDLLHHEALLHEARHHPTTASRLYPGPWSWVTTARASGQGTAILLAGPLALVTSLLALLCSLGRGWLRLAAFLRNLALAALALLLVVAFLFAFDLRHLALPSLLLDQEPGVQLRWLVPGFSSRVQPAFHGEPLAMLMIALAAPLAALAAVRVAIRRRHAARRAWLFAAALALPATLAAAVLALVWLRPDDPTFVHWPATLTHARLAIALVALAVVTLAALFLRRTIRHPRPRHPHLAATFAALGLAAFLATHTARSTLAAHTAAPNLGRSNLAFAWLEAPEHLTPPTLATCTQSPGRASPVVVRYDPGGQPVLEGEHRRWPIVRRSAGWYLAEEPDDFSLWLTIDRLSDHGVLRILADARLPADVLLPVLDIAQASGADRIDVQAVAEHTVHLPDRDIRTWTICTAGTLDHYAFRVRSLPAHHTWATVAADPAVVYRP